MQDMSSTAKPGTAPAGEQRVTLDALRRPMHDLRISLLDRCNFRCPYCMPATEFHDDYEFLNKSERLTHAEILQIAGVAVSLGVSKLRLTGGEPLLDKKLPDLVAGLASLDGVEDLALTTNAMLLAPVAQNLADAGLHRITVSLDSLDEAVFKTMSGGRGDLTTVLDGIAAAEKAGLTPLKINVVVERGVNDHTVLDLLGHRTRRWWRPWKAQAVRSLPLRCAGWMWTIPRTACSSISTPNATCCCPTPAARAMPRKRFAWPGLPVQQVANPGSNSKSHPTPITCCRIRSKLSRLQKS